MGRKRSVVEVNCNSPAGFSLHFMKRLAKFGVYVMTSERKGDFSRLGCDVSFVRCAFVQKFDRDNDFGWI